MEEIGDGEKEREREPEDQRAGIGRRCGGGGFVDEPGCGEDESDQGDDAEKEQVEPGSGIPDGSGMGNGPGPETGDIDGERFQAELEDDCERGGESERAEAGVGAPPPGEQDELGDAAGVEDEHEREER